MFKILSIDDHRIHIDEHIAYLLGNEIKKKQSKDMILEKLINHIEEHKKMLK